MRFTRQFIRCVVLAALTFSSIAVTTAALRTSPGYADKSSFGFNSGDRWPSGAPGYGFRLNFYNPPGDSFWGESACLTIWHRVSPNAPERFWTTTVGRSRFEYDSRRQFRSGVFQLTRVSPDPGGDPVRVAHLTMQTPAWVLSALFAAYPLWAFYRGPWRRRRRKAKGLCLRCGYNLTGNVTGKCSECGTPVFENEVPTR